MNARGAGGARLGGSALVVALWVLLILSVLVGSFAFDMRVEAGISSHYRKRLKAGHLARAGVEWARYALARSADVREGEPGADPDLYLAALHLSRGLGLRGYTRELGEGLFRVDILPEDSRRNVNLLTDDEWLEALDLAGAPEEQWDELIDCFRDWTDANEEHRLNGAESDDPWYEERGYLVRNGPVQLIEELTLIKGFGDALVYGGPAEDPEDPPLRGLVHLLTTWGDGRVNANTASREVLFTLVGVADWDVDAMMTGRLGEDGEPNTEDDGFRSVDEVLAVAPVDDTVADRISVSGSPYVRVISVGDVRGIRRTILCVLNVRNGSAVPVFWREEPMARAAAQ